MITERDIERIKPGETRWDGKGRETLPGFGLRRQGAGAASFILKYRAGGKQRVMTLGRAAVMALGDARDAARKALGRLAKGDDPQLVVSSLVSDLCDRWLAEHVATQCKPRTQAEYRRLVERVIKPRLGTVGCEALGRSHVAAFHHGLRGTPVEGNRALAALAAMLNWAERVGLRPDGSNPTRHVKRFGQKARERFLSAGELGRLGEALTAHGNPEHVAAVRLLVFTGARLGEVLGLRWEWIDGATARLPESKTGRKTLHLPPPAQAVLASLPRIEGCPFVFGWLAPDGAWRARGTTWIEAPWRRLRASAGLADVHLHDLRHSFASVGAASGLGLPVIGRLLGHAQASTTQRYAHVADDPAAAAAAAIAGRLDDALRPKAGAGNVTTLHRAG